MNYLLLTFAAYLFNLATLASAQEPSSAPYELAGKQNNAPSRPPAPLADKQSEAGSERKKVERPAYPAMPGNRDLKCLASAIWHEARGEPRLGQVAVAEVILARVSSGQFAKTICKVISQPGQFSFVEGGHIPAVPRSDLPHMLQIAREAIRGDQSSPVRGALYFHADNINPSWGRKRIGHIGDHVFYE